MVFSFAYLAVRALLIEHCLLRRRATCRVRSAQPGSSRRGRCFAGRAVRAPRPELRKRTRCVNAICLQTGRFHSRTEFLHPTRRKRGLPLAISPQRASTDTSSWAGSSTNTRPPRDPRAPMTDFSNPTRCGPAWSAIGGDDAPVRQRRPDVRHVGAQADHPQPGDPPGHLPGRVHLSTASAGASVSPRPQGGAGGRYSLVLERKWL